VPTIIKPLKGAALIVSILSRMKGSVLGVSRPRWRMIIRRKRVSGKRPPMQA
jgi:hypothetical protein